MYAFEFKTKCSSCGNAVITQNQIWKCPSCDTINTLDFENLKNTKLTVDDGNKIKYIQGTKYRYDPNQERLDNVFSLWISHVIFLVIILIVLFSLNAERITDGWHSVVNFIVIVCIPIVTSIAISGAAYLKWEKDLEEVET